MTPDGEGRQVWVNSLSGRVEAQSAACLAVYREDESRIEQDANNELRISEGGYSRRQLFELTQNAADAARNGGNRIEIRLAMSDHFDSPTLYVANDGDPFSPEGVDALMASDLSRKDDDRIGRFGIGFKSVLAVTDRPMVFSRSISFGFDASWAKETINAAGFEAPRYPVMRVARVLNAPTVAGADPDLAELMDWASTVIVLPLRARLDELQYEMKQFPSTFLLFSEHIGALDLVDAIPLTPGRRREIRRSESGTLVRIKEGSDQREWSVLSKTYKPGARALRDAGRVAGRESVTVSWAVQQPPSQSVGTFWAYFPTGAQTTLSGIVNAPWKLSDDRTNLLEGPFNEGMLTIVLPELVASGLAGLASRKDPGSLLDALPARGKEARSWGDDVINEPIFDKLRAVASLPDCNGTLRVPNSLYAFPEELPLAWLNDWMAMPGVPRSGWIHPLAMSTKERRNKVQRLGARASSVAGVLRAALGDGGVDGSERALKMAASMLTRLSTVREPAERRKIEDGIRGAEILLLEDGTLHAARKGSIFLRASADDQGDFVDPALASRSGMREALEALGIVVLDRQGRLRRALAEVVSQRRDDWSVVWFAARDLPTEVAAGIFREEIEQPESAVAVRTAARGWRPICQVFLAGPIIPADGHRDGHRLVDPRFHAEDRELLTSLGAVDQPVQRPDPPHEQWMDNYRSWAFKRYLQAVGDERLDVNSVKISERAPFWPLEPLDDLSPAARLAVTDSVVSRGVPVGFSASAPGHRRGTLKPPELWRLAALGMVRTNAFGPLRPRATLIADPNFNSNVLPVAQVVDDVAKMLGCSNSLDGLDSTTWRELKSIADAWVDDDRRAEFYSLLLGRAEITELTVRVGSRRQSVELSNIGVTADKSVFQAMIESNVPAMLVAEPDDVRRFIDQWRLADGAKLLEIEIVTQRSGEPTALVDEFPPLRILLTPDQSGLNLQRCSRIDKMVATPTGQVAVRINASRDEGTVFVTGTNDESVLGQVGSVLDLDLPPDRIRSIIRSIRDQKQSNLVMTIRRARDDDERLLAAVGADALRRQVPRHALQALDRLGAAAEGASLARLVRAVHGDLVLKQLRNVMEERGLLPPREWTGRRAARTFVTELGFPAELAGFPASDRPATQVVRGPSPLSELHGYQETVTARIKGLLRGEGPDRGVVSLPTGAGKTRVTVQALVEELRDGRLRGPIVWIAQSDELCEQAVETWGYVWRAIGPSADLTACRLWGPNEVTEEPSTSQLLVATVDKLDSIRKRTARDYEWMTDPSVVVVDEAHTSIATSYTAVLDWLGRGRSRSGGRRPLIGLTATPFRGTSKEETERLVGRYDRNRLDEGAFAGDPYEELQATKVLARVRQELLPGAAVSLDSEEEAEINTFRRVPAAVAARLGDDIDRTNRIVQSIVELPADWTVLLFATSVENARAIAALLAYSGVPAVAISADTDPAARRHYVEEFKRGRIRVLTNYNVLSQGFDAPATRAVYVTRPTFSPNMYQQMIGRGLRGPRNGGSDEVLIVNVEDNFHQFGGLLAFREFEYLWRRD